MMLMGFSCPNCGADVIDSIDHCYNCKAPYVGTLAAASRAHHQEKLTMIAEDAGRSVSTQMMSEKVGRLAAVAQAIAATTKAGGRIAEKIVSALFRDR